MWVFAAGAAQTGKALMSTVSVIEAQRPEFRTILFVTDFSVAANGALEWLKVLARQLRSSIVLTRFRQIKGRRPATGLPVQFEATDQRLQALRHELRQTTGSAVSVASFEVRHEMPSPSTAFEAQLRSIINDQNIGLIVLGTKAPQGLKRLARGSFAEGIFRHSDIPVMVVGPRAASLTPPPAFSKVVFATDFELESIQALPVASAFASRLGASLTLLTVNQMSEHFPGLIFWVPELLTGKKDDDKESVDRLRHLADRFALPDAGLVGLKGNPVKRISAYVNQQSVSALVLGIRIAEYEDAVAMHIPTLAGNLISRVSCPVLTFRGKYQSHGYQARPISGF